MKEVMIAAINDAIQFERCVRITIETAGNNCLGADLYPDAIDIKDDYVVVYSGHDICVIGTKQIDQVDLGEFICTEDGSRMTITIF